MCAKNKKRSKGSSKNYILSSRCKAERVDGFERDRCATRVTLDTIYSSS